MGIQIALYKKPPSLFEDWRHWLSHYAIRLWTWSRYSHGELVIDGISYSSSARDGGVRSKIIKFKPDRWDIFEIDPRKIDSLQALAFFDMHENAEYDWKNIIRYVLPFVRQAKDKFVCFEFMGAMSNFPGYYRLTGNDWQEWASRNAPITKIQDNDE